MFSFLDENGFLHFDAHFKNILTDGRRLYFADFGLATSSRFALSGPERDFFGNNLAHDRCFTVTQLVNWLVTALTGTVDPADRNAFIRRCARGEEPAVAPAAAAALISRYAAVAAVMNDFYRTLHLDSRTAPFPAEALEPLVADLPPCA